MAADRDHFAKPGMAGGDDLPILRFLTCGSVDDGKSTLIGRLLYDTKLVLDDTLAALEQESKTYGTTGGAIDLALLVDGLQAERAQGITIDVAYRYFSTSKRKFIVADTPGHEQYTRNMVTGASRCDLAVILVDARSGVVKQTRRHSCIVNLLGIRHVVLALNKMDLVGYDNARFDELVADYRAFAREIGLSTITAIPISALNGDNLISPSENMPWYRGPNLLEHLETVDMSGDPAAETLRLPVQWVCRPNRDFRGYAGTLAAGKVRKGDAITAMPSLQTASVASIFTYDGLLDEAVAGDAVTVTLDREIDVSRGDIICAGPGMPEISDQFTAHVVWMGRTPLLKGRPYLIKLGTQTATAHVTEIKYAISVETLEHLASRSLELNDVAVCNISTNKPLVIEPYATSRELGGFILIDRTTNETVCAGMIQSGLRRAHSVQWHELSVAKEQRAEAKGQKGCCIWLTGLPGSGKSTVANELEKRLFAAGGHTYMLDGENLRHGLNRDLGFTDADRVENIRRVAEVARLMVDAGLIAIVSFISPFRAERRFARELFEPGEFLEVFVDTPLAVCEARDPKGLYRKARAGEISDFTGISSAYEVPLNPECRLRGGDHPAGELAEKVFEELARCGIMAGHR